MNQIETDLNTFQQRFDLYEVNIEEDMKIRHQKFVEVDARQIDMELKWNRLHARICGLLKRAERESDTAFSEAFVDAISSRQKIMNSTEAKHYATCDKIYGDAKVVENKVFLLKKDAEAVVEALETRKYILKDLVAITINESQNKLI